MLAKPVSEDLIFDGELCFPSEFIQKGGLEDFQVILGYQFLYFKAINKPTTIRKLLARSEN